ncbi:MAG: sodium-translocating pyrophosphatase [Candidatus Bathyarchaeota archaeon]|nr:sodium-translocating pyrophosphatase [Candidatus Bathyarchaeota archaeon]
MELWLISLLAGLTSIAFAVYLFFYIDRQESGSAKMREVSAAIRDGAIAFLKREYYTLTAFVAVMALILAIFLNPNTALAYVFGSICSALAGLLGMDVALKANVKTANAAKKGLVKAFLTAFYGGAVMGLSVVGLALTGISILYYIYGDPNIILGFSLGASSLALFAKAGGGIYTKTADIGADLVGKVEFGIPEDDPRNPAVIADNVGDNVGDVAGTGADLFDSYVASTVSAMILGSSLERTAIQYEVYTVLPILLAAVGIFASILGTLFVRVKEGGDPGVALNRGTFSTCLMFVFFSYLLIHFLNVDLGVFYATTAGLVVGVLVGITTDYFTSINRGPVKKTAEAAKMGAALNILSGFSYGVISIAPTVIGICIATLMAWYFAGLYGISMSAVGMLSITGMIVSSDAYGPIVDNAKGIAEQSDLEPHVIKIGDKLDAAGNTTKAISKGFAIGAAALTVLALFASYSEIAEIEAVGLSLMRPDVMIGVFIGAAMPPLLSAMLILSVGRNAYRIVEEVRRQFREIPGLLQGRSKPDYVQCVDIATKGALRELSLPCALSVITPLTVGFLLGKYALGGFLVGSIVTGMIFAVFMATAGGQWDNAKKFIEEGAIGGKGSDVHKAAVIGDTVGDPFKDTAGPSLNTLICVMSLTASVFVPLILEYSLLKWSI